MDWKKFELVDAYTTNKKTGKPYYQQYLIPSYYLEVSYLWYEQDPLLQVYDATLEKIGSLFQYSQSGKQARETKIKNKPETFAKIRDLLSIQKSDPKLPSISAHYTVLGDVGGVGISSKDQFGGVGAASFRNWMQKVPFDEKFQKKRYDNYKTILKDLKEEQLNFGIPFSTLNISLPIDSFSSSQEFRDWILSLDYLQKGHFLSATAGCKINHWEGYIMDSAKSKLRKILLDFPGFDFGLRANRLASSIRPDGEDIIPRVKRVNWLTCISKSGLDLVGGEAPLKKAVKAKSIASLHELHHGFCLQASAEPAVEKENPHLEKYFNVAQLIEPLLYHPYTPRAAVKESFSYPDSETAEKWLYYFNPKT